MLKIMKYIFRNKLYKGTRTEIVDQLTIDLRDLLRYTTPFIQMELDKIPETYDFEIGTDTFSGTKEEILEQFVKVQKIAPIVLSSGCYLKILGVHVWVSSGEHVCSVRTKVINRVKGMIDEL